MPIKPFQPDDKQLVAGIKDSVYEYVNLLAAAHYSLHGVAPWRTNCDDAFLLGCRKVGDFLMDDTRRTWNGKVLDNVLARDFLPEDFSRNWDLPCWIGEWRQSMNTQLAHISYTAGKPWDHEVSVPALELEFREAWRKFRLAASTGKYGLEFDRQIGLSQKKDGFANLILEHL